MLTGSEQVFPGWSWHVIFGDRFPCVCPCEVGAVEGLCHCWHRATAVCCPRGELAETGNRLSPHCGDKGQGSETCQAPGHGGCNEKPRTALPQKETEGTKITSRLEAHPRPYLVIKADVQLPAALTGTDPSCCGDTPCKPYLGHLKSMGSVRRGPQTQAAFHSLDISLQEWDGALQGCLIPHWVLGWQWTARHSFVAGSVLVAPRCTAPPQLCHIFHGTMEGTMDGTMERHLALPPQSCCQGRTSLPATPPPAKGG